jgi:hypothetical protein
MRRLRGLNFECLMLLKTMILILTANLAVACVFFFSPVYARFGGFGCAHTQQYVWPSKTFPRGLLVGRWCSRTVFGALTLRSSCMRRCSCARAR